MRCEAKKSSGCRVPHVTEVRYGNSLKEFSIKIRLCDRWRVFSVSGKCFFLLRMKLSVSPLQRMENTGWHHENIVPDILKQNQNVRDFFLFGRALWEQTSDGACSGRNKK